MTHFYVWNKTSLKCKWGMIINNNIYIFFFLNLDVKSVIQKVGSGRMSPIRAHTMKDLEQVSKKKSKRGYPLFYQVSVINNTMSRRYNKDSSGNHSKYRGSISWAWSISDATYDLIPSLILMMKYSKATSDERLTKQNVYRKAHVSQCLYSFWKALNILPPL